MKKFLLTAVEHQKPAFAFLLLLFGITLTGAVQVNAQDRVISGQVLAMLDNTPLPGANVLVKGTTSGTVTDVDGGYSISVNENDVLVFSYIGYSSEEVPVSSINGNSYNIALAEDISTLSEIVVVGYGSVKKSDVTGAVASVTPEEITKIATPDVVQALQGRVAGVQVIANSGEPGAGVKIRIRGVSSINGGSSPLYVVDGFQTGDISYLNPNDIQSVEILKDASATAIYGSRGASGVVVITTKKGVAGKPRFTFDAYGGIQQAGNTLDLLNAPEYATLRLEAYANDGIELDPLNEEFVRLDFAKQGGYEGTDWQDEILNAAPMQNYSLSVAGGSEKMKYSLSGTYFSQEGLVKNSGMEKFFFNLNTDYELSEWLSAGVIANFVNTDKSNYNNDFYSGVLPTAVAASPVIPAWDEPTQNFGRDDISYTNNAARIVSESKYDNYLANKLVGNIFLNAQIIEGLSFRTQLGLNLDNRKDKVYRPQFFMATDEARDRSELYERRGESFGWISTNYFTYERAFGDHSLTAMAGFEGQYGRYNDVSVTGFDVPLDENQHYLGAANDPEFVVRSYQDENALQSYFGRVNYSFLEKYLLTATVRYDGSSRFTEDYRWGVFPSATAGWILSQEQFMQNITPVSFLKVRAGWGQVGNQNVGNYRFVTTVDINQLYVLGDQIVQGAAPRTLSNPSIQWETTETMNFGLDAGFLDDKLTLTADYFIKKTRDMLLSVPIPAYVGALSPTVNAGTMENKGIELALGYRNEAGKLRYEFNVNVDAIRNEITSLAGGEPISSGGVGKVGNTTRTEEGHEIAYFYGLQTDGIFNTEDELNAYVNADGDPILPAAGVGDVKFVDTNGDGKVDANDRVKLGSATPDFTFGFSTNLSYGNFDFSFLLTGVQGTEAVNGLAHLLRSSNGLNNSYSSRMDRWTPDNPNTDEPRMTFADANRNAETFSDRYVEDASYIRLRTIQLGYKLPLSRFNIETLRVYIAADNLFTVTDYTGFDPEVADLYQNALYYGVDQATYPNPQVFRAGVNLKF